MDPISAFQLAAAVINVVDFGSRLLSDTYEIYQSGSGSKVRDVELSKLSQDLSDLGAEVQSRIPSTSVASPTRSEAVLLDLSQRCVTASDKLQKAINDLQANATGGGRISTAANSFGSALRGLWKKSEIEGLKETLTEIRSQMTIATLVSVWEETRQDGWRHADLSERLDQIAKKLDRPNDPARQFATELMQMTLHDNSVRVSRRNADLIKILWDIDWASWAGDGSFALPLAPAQATRAPVGDVPVTMKILSSLSFSGMYAREEAIPEAYAATFKWIFTDEETDSDGTKLEWPSLPRWLQQSGDCLYWVTGKPGSGKSTLMKYIFEHPDLPGYLEGYAGRLQLLLAGFFFWNPGSQMQKSNEGLVRTLLHQCLQARQDLIPAVAPRRWALFNLLGSDTVAPEWTWRELKESFETLCSFHGRGLQLAIFIDGLDEFEGAERSSNVLIGWIKDIISRHGIKFCVSSRPWNVFSDAFRKDLSLTMQSLTRRDIEHFVRTEFDDSAAFQELEEVFPNDASALLADIITRAEGVFLWVSLVVRALLSTLTDVPSLPHAREKLAEIPSDIRGLYNSIWRSIPSERTSTTSKILQLCASQYPSTTLQDFWVALYASGYEIQADIETAANRGLAKIAKRLLDGHTRGICELASGRVAFLHRSAADWILSNSMWAELCAKSPPGFEPYMALLEAFLSSATSTNSLQTNLGEASIFNTMFRCFSYVSRTLESGRVDKGRVMVDIDRVNKLACDMGVAACANGKLSGSARLTVKSTDPNVEGFSAFNWLSLQLPHTGRDIEQSFVGCAARAGWAEYVKFKVAADRTLLLPKKRRVSLLESAIFPELNLLEAELGRIMYIFLPKLPAENRLEIIRFLLEDSETLYETAFGQSMYDAVCKATRSELPGSTDKGGFYEQVLQLLDEHGYRRSESSVFSESKGNSLMTVDGSLVASVESAKRDDNELRKPKKRSGALKRIIAKIMS